MAKGKINHSYQQLNLLLIQQCFKSAANESTHYFTWLFIKGRQSSDKQFQQSRKLKYLYWKKSWKYCNNNEISCFEQCFQKSSATAGVKCRQCEVWVNLLQMSQNVSACWRGLTLSLIRQFCSRRLWTYFVK